MPGAQHEPATIGQREDLPAVVGRAIVTLQQAVEHGIASVPNDGRVAGRRPPT